MDIISAITGFFAVIGESGLPEINHFIGKWLIGIVGWFGDWNQGFGWAVVIFTIFIRLALSPLDIWTKIATRKQSRDMARVQPQLNKLQKEFGSQPEVMRQKQQALYKEFGISPFSQLLSCVPMLINMVVFFIVFAGFRAAVAYRNEVFLYNIANEYLTKLAGQGFSLTDINAHLAKFYTEHMDSFLLTKNIYMPDTFWSAVVPTMDSFQGAGAGKIGGQIPSIVEDIVIGNAHGYAALMNPAIAEFSDKKNGYLMLPALSIAFMFLSSWLSQKITKKKNPLDTGEQSDAQKKAAQTSKMMMWLMPIMYGGFALLYNGAFSLYSVISGIASLIITLAFNVISTHFDKKEDDELLSNTFVKKSGKKETLKKTK